MIQLTGEQLRILQLPLKNPVLIKGSAGSGKTTVAVARAQHLVNSGPSIFGPNSVGVFTYTNALVNYVDTLLKGTAIDGSVVVRTFHKFAYEFISQKGKQGIRSPNEYERKDLIARSLSATKAERQGRILQKPVDFFAEEIKWLKGRRVLDLETYRKTPRLGRGRTDKVTAADKDDIWPVFERYQQELRRANCLDFDDYALRMIELIDADSSFIPPFTHVVIDEAQDLAPAQLIAIYKLVKPEFNSISLVADAAQMIYRSGFSWANLGFTIKGGRSVELRVNYRNTKQIAQTAISLLQKEEEKGDFTDQSLPAREGPRPRLHIVAQGQSQIAKAMEMLASLPTETESCVILHRSRQGMNEVHKFVSMRFPVTKIEKGTKSIDTERGIYTTTMHSVKGLEFDHVLIIDITEGVMPELNGVDPEEVEDVVSVERKLLYTAMTRARKRLDIFTADRKESRLLAQIAQETIEVVRP